MIVTAADHRYARTLLQMLASARRHRIHESSPVVAFDLGMDDEDRARIGRAFPWCRVERFDFDSYPIHVRTLGNYAWKPCVVWNAADRSGGPLLWFDSATVFHGNLDAMLDAVERDGVFSLVGQSTLEEICDPRSLAVLNVPPEDRRRRYRASGVLGFAPNRPFVRALLRDWRDCALNPECIAPDGWTLARHKPDQATVTALILRARREHGLHVGDEEIDISSIDPVPWISTRNKVSPWVPMAADPAVRACYAVWKKADRLVLRARGNGGHGGDGDEH